MTLSFNEALNTLNSTPATTEALMELVNQISIEAGGSVTVFYGGAISEQLRSDQIIQAMIDNGEDIRVIDKSAAAAFLESNEFYLKWHKPTAYPWMIC